MTAWGPQDPRDAEIARLHADLIEEARNNVRLMADRDEWKNEAMGLRKELLAEKKLAGERHAEFEKMRRALREAQGDEDYVGEIDQ